MSESLPKVAGKVPAVLDLNAGTHYWCSCGLSADGTFCNGAHKGTGLVPVKIELAEPAKKALCLCKKSKSGPYCDGSHSAL